MLIGVDFDNTLAGYDRVFALAAEREGLLELGTADTKARVREAIRQRPGGERDWMRLQGRVYGAHMCEAALIDGAGDFINRCRTTGIGIRIISHKTEFGHFDPDRINLRDAARSWMENMGFFDSDGFGLSTDAVFFESTRQEKVTRIASIGCTHFIDDLEEVFREPGFPDATERYLFAAGAIPLPNGPFRAFDTWSEISDDIFDH